MTVQQNGVVVVVAEGKTGRRRNRFAGWWEFTLYLHGEPFLVGGSNESSEAAERVAWAAFAKRFPHRAPPSPGATDG